MDTLILIGIIMTVSGIIVWILGAKRGVPNTLLWALFPIIHGFHEFAEYALDELGAPFVVERLELLMAISSSLVLLAASIEYNGGFSKPSGKIAGLVGFGFSAYILFIFPEELIEEMHNVVINFGILESDPFRFFFGFILVLLSMLSLLISYWNLKRPSRISGSISIDNRTKKTTYLGSFLLFIFAIFEGFNSENPVFVTLRAISLALFIVVPVVVIFSTKLGLQKILVIKNTGALILGYNFSKEIDIFNQGSIQDQNEAILASGFLSAISGFSDDVLKAGSSFTIRSNKLYFILYKNEDLLYTIQSISTNKTLENKFEEFVENNHDILKDVEQPSDLNFQTIETSLKNNFKNLY